MVNNIATQGNTIVTLPNDGHDAVYVTSGTNAINFTSLQSNKWVSLYWNWGGCTASATLSNIRLLFNNNQSLTIQQAVNNGYIEPLVTYISADTTRVDNMSYVLDNPEQLISGGSQTKLYSNFTLDLKVKNLSPLKGISFESTGFSDNNTVCRDGFNASSSDTVEFTL